MRWTERQRAMLEEIGVRLWLAPAAAPYAGAEAVAAVAVASASTATPPPTPQRDEQAAPRRLPTSAALAGAAAGAGSGAAAGAVDRAELAVLGLPALAERAAACTACALCAGRSLSVFGAGAASADWMIVGDAPADDDDRSGEPFSGKAGLLLDNMLAAIELTRGAAAAPSGRAYLTHTVKCRPPAGRAPEADEVACCEPFLLRQIELVQPRVIVAMGRVAARALTGSAEPFGKVRGQVHRYRGIPVVAAFHPGYLLRHAEDKAGAWADLCLALQTVKDAPPR